MNGSCLCCLATLLFAMAVPGQQVGPLMSADLQVTSDFFVQVEHQSMAPQSRLGVAAPAQLAFPTGQAAHPLSGLCTGDALLITRHDGYGNPCACADFLCTLATAGSGLPAHGESGMEIVVTFQSPVPVRGTLEVSVDLSSCYGPNSQGQFLVDVGNDGRFDFAIGGQSAMQLRREFPLSVGASGGAVRILHMGSAIGDNIASGGYHSIICVTFYPEVSPATFYRPGCKRLQEVRWGNGAVAFLFESQPGPALCVLAVGSPVVPRPFRPGAGHCDITQSLDAVMVVSGFNHMFPPTLLPAGGQAVVQGFVFRPDGIWPTDSWIVN
jgi:hypothetical protein